MTQNLTFFATAAKGMEPLLADELRQLGGLRATEARAGVSFGGDLELGYRTCLWSRVASRVLLNLASFPAATPEELYDGVRSIAWHEHLTPEGSLAVDANVVRSQVSHSHYAALKVKDAVVDHFRDGFGVRPYVELERPDVRINLFLKQDQATVSIDLSGESLHRRGYREEGVRAPLKESLAAALLIRAGWPAVALQGGGLVDPMCGSGTLPVEAALMAGDVAPGMLRTYFGFIGWKGHDRPLWERLLAEAGQRREAGLAGLPPIHGTDVDGRAVEAARSNARRAGLDGVVRFERCALEEVVPGNKAGAVPGLVVVNPPYGERLGDVDGLRPLYALLGDRLKEHFPAWKAAVFTGNPELGKEIGLRACKIHTLFNGALKCQLLHFEIDPRWYWGSSPRAGRLSSPSPLGEGALMFANRLRKNMRHLGRWARRNAISCYRLYDADLPEYAVAVDLYGEWVHVQEYEAPNTVDPEKARTRLKEVMAVLPEILNVPQEQVFLKVRRRQKGRAQYVKLDGQSRFHEVREGECRFLVNLADYLDTGLFLDHRPMRFKIGEMARGKRFLNLFAYTGTATVHAALGGAASTTSVDLSATYLDWARRNLALNGLDDSRHELVQADCLSWLEKESRRFDLIFLDPPTFSNSKRMEGDFDVQRDHVALLEAAARLLAPGGELFFSTNNRGFRLDPGGFSRFNIEDISSQTIPQDFQRNPRIHRCWRVSLP
ncbi:MAG: bifunctional 23S rRNA (guanine(2069)-N(7))-methyltransferase RlmK/23S rRNA (guanine(2445)-N(2))-methyltransferase RlmL [Desulfuromonas sp.]|uniref:bifunctional 23S rRNA (guanine(2069)-N(7))-methyltransferase RlmK/23S rRNA (guanine(2445)-N(2))-methyltransferase RlmL n=1 Tax=Desulfuromonas sp. TaxID=892 RepID=UPI000CB3EAD8|nr:bifunctional 23S rRNA (guanine(2069)-N(7))-methyltransferase RlmK/23S rRNA (guanine(2445)-N(2))-methyltransferase RlmL [Desulfuromonas sp.]PLX84634.1 MAG: bifunctional 23S rRNA (guanine(2069)-N(7))-methyltransferase RlmK/23S rRNA (guanine(2445)-N(2))-methyltransferase RlmL [Desulfuromonas sp.]